MNFLACDLGGTKVLLGIFSHNKNDYSPNLILKKKYISSEWKSIDLILKDFLQKECKDISYPSTACFAVAGPVKNNNAKQQTKNGYSCDSSSGSARGSRPGWRG